MNLSTVKKRLEAKPSLCYQSSAEFVSDIRLIFGNFAVLSEVPEIELSYCILQLLTLAKWTFLLFSRSLLPWQNDSESVIKCRKLKELFEEHLKLIYRDQTFPDIKLEMINTAPPDSHLSSLDNMSQLAKRQRTCSGFQDTPSCPWGEEGVAWKHKSSWAFGYFTTLPAPDNMWCVSHFNKNLQVKMLYTICEMIKMHCKLRSMTQGHKLFLLSRTTQH